MTDKHWPAIGDYALIGDCRTAALVARNGAVEWLCLPDFDSPSLFAAILDRRKGGRLAIALRDAAYCERRYLDGTNVLETTISGPSGTIRLTDFLVIGGQLVQEPEPQRELLRIVDALDGEPEIEVTFEPAPDYGRRRPRIRSRGRLGWTLGDSGSLFLLRTDIPLEATTPASLCGRVRLAVGDRRCVSLSFAAGEPATIPLLDAEAQRKLDATTHWWRRWSDQCTYRGPFRNQVVRSALVLKSLQFCLSGAVVAAPTCSLPEAIGGGRNWDYRYCWLRDAAFMMESFIDTGFLSEAKDFFGWLMHATKLTHPKLKPLYDLYGRTWFGERTLDHLSGYRETGPVRIGNSAKNHLQLDIFGSLVAAATIYLDRGHALRPSEKSLLIKIGEAACAGWQQPDNGFWEYRHGRRHNTWSKVMCWSCLDNLIRLHDEGILSVPRERFDRERQRIRDALHEKALAPERGSWIGAFGEDFLDATLLLLPTAGFVEARDPRMMSTWERIERELGGPRGLIRRYSEGVDVQRGREGTFVICSFWAVAYLARAGRVDEARRRMENLLGYANELGLYAEELDAASGAMLGNFPQAFSHSGLIHAALAIADAERKRAA